MNGIKLEGFDIEKLRERERINLCAAQVAFAFVHKSGEERAVYTACPSLDRPSSPSGLS